MFNDKRIDSVQNSVVYDNEIWLKYLLRDYLKDNPKSGNVVFQVSKRSPTTLQEDVPIANAKILISKPLGNNYFVSKVLITDAEGKTQPISLPTVQSDLFSEPGSGDPYTTYNVRIEAPNYLAVELFNLHVFQDITSFQNVKLIPLEESQSNSE